MRKRPGQKILGAILVGAVLVVVNGLGGLRPLRAVTGFVLAPAGGLFSGVGRSIAGFGHLVMAARSLSADNQRLEGELADLRQRVTEDAAIRDENTALRTQLRFGQVPTNNLRPAQIISYQPDNFRQFMTINRGSRDGLREGQAVVAEGQVMVGKLSEVTPTTAKVFLLTDPDFKVGAFDQDNPSRPSGTVNGQIGSGLIMDRIPQDQTVKIGDTIVTSGLGGELPKGLIIGRVESVNQKDNAVFQSAQVVSSLKYNQLELVFVIVDATK